MSVNPEEFAAQINYLAGIGRMIVPRAFRFAGQELLFVGHLPFHPEELGSLLPEETAWYEHSYMPEQREPNLVVLGRAGYEQKQLHSLLKDLEGPLKVLPQEGFVDELLFGHDWWGEEAGSLRSMVDQHRGLQGARSAGLLAPVGVELPRPVAKPGSASTPTVAPVTPPANKPHPVEATPKSGFSWPSTEAEESKNHEDADLLELRERSRLNELGYNTNLSRSARWDILTRKAIPELGLPKIASLIAWFCRSRKQQVGGRRKFARAIGEWEHDLDRLKREVYPGYRPKFEWPRSEPR